MGLFDFLKKDNTTSSILTTDNGWPGPTYLADYTEHIAGAKKVYPFEWRRKLISTAGNSKFKIKYYGQLLHAMCDILIVGTDFAPALVVAKDIVSGQEILLFDGCKNGFNPMFCDEFTSEQITNRPLDNWYIDRNKNDSFEIILSAYYQIDFDDESEGFLEDVDENGFIELADQSKMEFEKAKRNAFDVFQIIAITENGRKIEVLAEELA
ncbi:hypothetical protein [Xanthocytophaga agilis]|uniref:Uncharacterized protein n=1 Tax=Xanthocytophaga agilis TaxID=3048010 RepID=A0AAE3RDR3_9BACT|nr:hypothetical protein [Xanthocytophaga agilis]MDJ1506092.1 hypothetical protein [Xanthocytophaga agilis]